MITTRRIRKIFPLLAAFAALALAYPQPGVAQTGLAVLNDSHQEVRVYAFHDDVEERVLLGWVGGDELEYFRVPEEALSAAGSYRIAVQQITPLPQIGVPATPHPLEATPTLSPEGSETVRLVVGDGNELSFQIIQ